MGLSCDYVLRLGEFATLGRRAPHGQVAITTPHRPIGPLEGDLQMAETLGF
jgi:hypothetical protein